MPSPALLNQETPSRPLPAAAHRLCCAGAAAELAAFRGPNRRDLAGAASPAPLPGPARTPSACGAGPRAVPRAADPSPAQGGEHATQSGG